MSLGKLWVLVITPILYAWHYSISWYFYKFSKKAIYDDLRKLGSEFAFVAITFWVAALLDTTSRLNTILDAAPRETVTGTTISTLLLILFFDAVAVFFYKTYEEKKKKNIIQYWRLFISLSAGIIILGTSILMI